MREVNRDSTTFERTTKVGAQVAGAATFRAMLRGGGF